MVVTKRALGEHYVIGTGILLSIMYILTLLFAVSTRVEIVIGMVGLLSAITLTASFFWLDTFEMADDQVWRISIHSGLGLGLVTIFTFLTFQFAESISVSSSTDLAIMSSTIAFGGTIGTGIGILREFKRSTTTLSQSTEVLTRVLRHDVRNDMTVVLGHLDKLEAEGDRQTAHHSQIVRSKIDDVVALSEKAQKVERAVKNADRRNKPINIAANIERQLEVVRNTHPDVDIRTDMPETAWVNANWMIEIAFRNILENAIVGGEGCTSIELSISNRALFWVDIEIVDTDGNLSAVDLEALAVETETPLLHGTGLDLWLAYWIVKSCNGKLRVNPEENGGSITIRMRRKWPMSYYRTVLEQWIVPSGRNKPD